MTIEKGVLAYPVVVFNELSLSLQKKKL